MSRRKITALGFRHWSQRCKSLAKCPMVSSSSRLTPSHVAFARTPMGSSLALSSASAEFQPFPLFYVHLIGVILGSEGFYLLPAAPRSWPVWISEGIRLNSMRSR